MTKQFLLLTVSAALLLCSCSSNKKTEQLKPNTQTEIMKPENLNVPFTEAKHYFVRNDYKDGELHFRKITSRDEFDSIFGMAAVMGKDGRPTNIDFSAQYVIALIDKISDRAADIEVINLTKSGETVTVNYSYKEGEKLTFTLRISKILIVDNQYKGEIKLQTK